MNRIGLLRALALAMTGVACAFSAHAQTPRHYAPTVPALQEQRFESAVPRGLADQRVEPSGELAPSTPAPVPPRLVQNERRAQSDADARHCLTAASNEAIHRCAERYRNRAARAATVRKASAKPPAAATAASPPTGGARASATTRAAPEAVLQARPPAAPITTTPDLAKPGGAPRPSDTAKAADLVKPIDVTKPAASPRPVDSSAKAPTPGPRLPPTGSAADPTAAPPAKK